MTKDAVTQFEQRKRDHIQLALRPENQAVMQSELDSITLQHDALPELDFEDISLAGKRFGQTCQTPFLVSSMTAGHNKSLALNYCLASVCSERGWALGVGSQRRQLFDKAAASEWQSIKKDFPNLELYGNLGVSQLIQTPIDDVHELIASLGAQGIFIHCNALQECLQIEGTPQFKGAFDAIKTLSKTLTVPVIVKETGCGFSKVTLKKLRQTRVAAVDVSGLGGTHWGRIEGMRAQNPSWQTKASHTFQNWGITTIQSIIDAKHLKPNYEIWGSGGVRSGLDAAKLLALGATTIGIAQPILKAALCGPEPLNQIMHRYEQELRIALFCTGSATLSALTEQKICR